jgi:type II secretory pathway component PulJ
MAEQVVLRQNFQNEMTPADRIRYYLGLPQGYPMNPVLIEKAIAKLHAREDRTPFEAQVMFDVHSAWAAQSQDERSYEPDVAEVAEYRRSRGKESLLRMAADEEERYSPMWNAQYAMSRLYGDMPSSPVALGLGHTRSGPEVFPTQQAAAAHLQRSGFRDPGESLQQARQRLARAQARAWQADAAGMTGAQGQSITADDKVGGRSKTYTRRRVSDWFLPGGIAGVEGSIRQSERGVRGHIGSDLRDEEEVGFQRRQKAARARAKK